MNHLNLFHPYERRGAGHEDALTRAFLLVLRGVPLAHATWLALVDRAHRANRGEGVPALHTLPTPRVYLQTAKVPEETARIVSLVQTDEEVFRGADAMASERRQVLDGVVSYGDFAIVVENKPRNRDIWEGQLDVNVPEGVAHDPRVACIAWKDLVSAFEGLAEAGHLGVAEAMVLRDFLDYVSDHFPRLRPYSKVALCGTDEWRLERRCEALLKSIAGSQNVDYHRGWGYYIQLADNLCARKIGLFPGGKDDQPDSLVVEVDPADTIGQARLTYASVQFDRVQKLLEDARWRATPNFHLMFMTSGCFRIGGALDVPEYWATWAANLDSIRQWRRSEFDDAFDRLLGLGIVKPSHRTAFDEQTIGTRRPNVGFAPGVTLRWTLPLGEAVALDAQGKLESEITEAMARAATALNLKLPW
ncbi:MAG: hypothetical protein ABW061_03130 [Polyangiaceae bacterium]